MSLIEDFLSSEDEDAIVTAIREAELKTSGEIRVHIETSSNENHDTRAKEVFHFLKMDNTKLQNGVLIYLAVKDQSFVILGDKGINDVVPNNFWESTRNSMQTYFKNGEFTKGIITGILETGSQLATFFPWQHLDSNELSNEISKS